MPADNYGRSRRSSETIEIEALLMRYPNLSEQELATLINQFPHIKILDLGLMTADERLSAKLDAFHRDHGRKLKTPTSSLLAFLAVPTLALIGLLWWALAPIIGGQAVP